MQKFFLVLCAIATLCLAGCYTSDKPLISAEDAVFPFETITFRETGSPIETTMTREGDAYVVRSNDTDALADLRLKDLGNDLYVVQITGEDRLGNTSILYGMIRFNRGDMTAAAYGAVAQTSYVREGLRDCSKNVLCIDDLDVYVDLVKSTIADNEDPSVVYEIVNAR